MSKGSNERGVMSKREKRGMGGGEGNRQNHAEETNE